VAGYVRGLLKIGISLLATVLSIVLVMFLAPYVSDALIKWTPADEMIEEKCMEMFMPQISADTLKNADLSGTSLGELNQDQLAESAPLYQIFLHNPVQHSLPPLSHGQ
jgi:hypothetical protein